VTNAWRRLWGLSRSAQSRPAARARRRTRRNAAGFRRFVVATAAAGDEQRASVPPGEVVVEGPGGDRGEHDCRSPAAFAGDVQHPVASLGAEVGGVGRQRLTDAQAVVGEQGEQGQVPAALAGAGGGPLPGEGEHGPELVTVEPGGLAVVSDFGPAHAGDRRPVDEVFVGGVAVEAGDRGQAPGHGFGGARPHALWSYFCRLDHVHVELCEPHELAEPDLARRPVPGHQAGRVCRFWALACGVTEVVIRWKEPEDILCRRHRRWSRWASASWGW